MKPKPCPFCGATRIKTRRYSEMYEVRPDAWDYYKRCENCGAGGPPSGAPTAALVRWNNRRDDPTGTHNPPEILGTGL